MTSLPHSAVSLPPDISRGYQYIAVQWSLVSVSTLVVTLRFCIRGLLRRRIGEDDYTILAALVSYLPPHEFFSWRLSNQRCFQACALVQSVLAIYQVKTGFGRNVEYVQPTQIENLTRETFVSILFNLIGTSFVRISVCLFILQILPFTQRFYRR